MASNSTARAAEKLSPKSPPSWGSFVAFLKGVREELKKAHWPSREELIRLTQVTLLLIFVVAAFWGALDAVLGFIAGKLLMRK
jgi:preprotein translocase SecE subunit